MPNAHQLADYLAGRKTLEPFWLVTGADELLKLESIDAIRRRARELGYEDREVLDLSARSDWSQLPDAAAAMGMFASQKIIEVRLASSRPGTTGTDILTKYVAHPYDGVVTIFSVPEVDWQVQKSAWWTTVSRASTVVDCSPVERPALPGWLAKRMARHKQSASKDALEAFADLVEGNLLAASQEVEKLALLYPEGELTLEEIEAGVSNCSRFDAASLNKSVSLGEPDRAARIVDGLEAQAEALPMVLVFFTGHVRNIAKLRAAYDAGQSRAQGVFATPELQRAARRLTMKKLEAALLILAEIDRLAKGLPVPDRDSDPWVELKSVALFLAR